MKFSIIVAMDQNQGIGKGGGLPWDLPEDLRHFKNITTTVENSNKKNVVVMGRKTWQSLPEKFKPLPNRINVVLTRNNALTFPENVYRCGSFDKLGNLLKGIWEVEKTFIIGGEQIFKEAIDRIECQEIFLTKVHSVFKCDTFFPDVNRKYNEIEVLGEGQSSDLSCSFLRLVRNTE